MDRNVVPSEGVDQAAIEVLEQPAAVFGEGAGGLVEDQVMLGLQELVIGERTVVFVKQSSASSVGGERLEGLVGRDQDDWRFRAGHRAGSGRSCRRLPVQPRDHALAEFVADLEPRGRGGFDVSDGGCAAGGAGQGGGGSSPWTGVARGRHAGFEPRCGAGLLTARSGADRVGCLGRRVRREQGEEREAACNRDRSGCRGAGQSLRSDRTRMRRASPQPPSDVDRAFHGRCSLAGFV